MSTRIPPSMRNKRIVRLIGASRHGERVTQSGGRREQSAQVRSLNSGGNSVGNGVGTGTGADGPRATLNHCLDQHYDDLRGLARARIRRLPPGRTLHTNTLVQEAVLRLQERDRRQWARPNHFLADVKQAMRDIVVEYIRRKQAVKHGGHLDRDDDPGTLHGEDGRRAMSGRKLALARALETMQERHPEAAAIVVLRHVHGFTVDECAEHLGLAPRTVARKWVFARTWLKSELAKA